MGETLERNGFLRPLGIGEIFDRAITLYVRNVPAVSIVAALTVVPLSVIQYVQFSVDGNFWQQITGAGSRTAPAGFSLGASLAVLAALAVVAVTTPLTYVALAALVRQIYRGESADWRSALAGALRKTLALIGASLLAVLVAGAITIGAGILFAIIMSVGFGAATVSRPLGFVTLAIGAIGLLAFILVMILCYIAVVVGFDAVGIEGLGAVAGVSAGFSRIFSRREFGRASLVALALIALELGLFLLAGGVEMLVGMSGQPLLETIVTGLVSLMTNGVVGVLLAVYYFDVRIRHEGLDVQAAIDTLAAPAP